MLDVRMFGTPAFLVDGAHVGTELGKNGRLLACYLFEFVGRPHRRERLADLFWSQLPPDKGRLALNTAIWRLRRMLDLDRDGPGGRQLITIGDEAVIEIASTTHVDTVLFENASRAAIDPIEKGYLAAQRAIADAIETYRGPFLEGDEEVWVLEERERLHRIYTRSLTRLMHGAARERRYEEALEFGHRILSIDAFRENSQRDVMLLLLLNGQRAEAIWSYRRLGAALKRELGVDPMPETQRLAREITSGEVFSRLDEYHRAHFGNDAPTFS